MSSEPDKVTQAYRFALDPTPAQARALASHVGAARFAFNRMLAEVKADLDRWNAGEETRLEGWSLAALRRVWNANKDQWAFNAESGEPWWGENAKDAYDSALACLAAGLRAWRDSRDGRRKGPPVGFPRFKKRSQRTGVEFANDRVRLSGDRMHVRLPRIGWVKAHEPTRKLARRLEQGTARILAATVTCDAGGRWHVAFTCEVARRRGRPAHVGRRAAAAGVDVGVARLATIARSDGSIEEVENPRALEATQKRLRRLQRKRARQQPGSRRQRRTRARIGRMHRRAANVRADALAKLATELAQRHDAVAVETLHAKGLTVCKPGMGTAGRAVNRALSDAALAEVRRQLSYKSQWYASTLVEADRWYPSSKMCSACGAAKAKLSLAERRYCCEHCGASLDRDANAARNLLHLAEGELAELGTGSGPGTRPQLGANGRGAERETEAARAADAAGDEPSTPHRPLPGKTGTVSPQGEAV